MTARENQFSGFDIIVSEAGTEVEVLDPEPYTLILIDDEVIYVRRCVYMTPLTHERIKGEIGSSGINQRGDRDD